MFCNKCGSQMTNIMHFETSREFQFHYCDKCNKRTKHKRIHYDTEHGDRLIYGEEK